MYLYSPSTTVFISSVTVLRLSNVMSRHQDHRVSFKIQIYNERTTDPIRVFTLRTLINPILRVSSLLTVSFFSHYKLEWGRNVWMCVCVKVNVLEKRGKIIYFEDFIFSLSLLLKLNISTACCVRKHIQAPVCCSNNIETLNYFHNHWLTRFCVSRLRCYT